MNTKTMIDSIQSMKDADVIRAIGDSNVLVCVRAICETASRGNRSADAEKALLKRENDERPFWNQYTVGTFAKAALDVLSVKRYSGQDDEVKRLISSGLNLF